MRIRLNPCLPDSAADGRLPPSAAFSLPSTVSLAPMLLWSLKAPPLPTQSSLTHSLTLPICCYLPMADQWDLCEWLWVSGFTDTASLSWSGQWEQSCVPSHIDIYNKYNSFSSQSFVWYIKRQTVMTNNKKKPIKISQSPMWHHIPCFVQNLKGQRLNKVQIKTEKISKSSHVGTFNTSSYLAFLMKYINDYSIN